MKYTPITVYGFTISEETQEAALKAFIERIRKEAAQPPSTLQAELERRGVPNDKGQAYRGTDRLIQKARKAKLIEHNRSLGGWILGDASVSAGEQNA